MTMVKLSINCRVTTRIGQAERTALSMLLGDSRSVRGLPTATSYLSRGNGSAPDLGFSEVSIREYH